MPRVIIESPYKGTSLEDREQNIRYLKLILADSVSRGEVPFASHAFFPFFLNEDNPEDRELGITLGYDFWAKADKVVFYMDLGMSPGMKEALAKAFIEGKPFEQRKIMTEVAEEVKKFAPKSLHELIQEPARE